MSNTLLKPSFMTMRTYCAVWLCSPFGPAEQLCCYPRLYSRIGSIMWFIERGLFGIVLMIVFLHPLVWHWKVHAWPLLMLVKSVYSENIPVSWLQSYQRKPAEIWKFLIACFIDGGIWNMTECWWPNLERYYSWRRICISISHFGIGNVRDSQRATRGASHAYQKYTRDESGEIIFYHSCKYCKI